MKFRASSLICVLAMLVSSTALADFNYTQYRPSNLDDLLAQPRPEAGVRIFGQKLKLEVTLVAYGQGCDTSFLKRSMVMVGIASAGANIPISKCIKVKSPNGQVASFYIQDVVSEYLPKEIPLGSIFSVYVLYQFSSKDGPGILVNEFQSQSAKSNVTNTEKSKTSGFCTCATAELHTGLDWAGPPGTPIPVAETGTVVAIVNTGSTSDLKDGAAHCGRYVVVLHKFPNGKSAYTRYAQLGTLQGSDGKPIRVGQTVASRQVIGQVGAMGLFHFEVRPFSGGDLNWTDVAAVDPSKFVFSEYGRKN